MRVYRKLRKVFPILLCLIMFCQCSSNQIEVQSTPSGADVLSPEGEKLGQTPLVLSGDTLVKAVRNGRLNLVVTMPKFNTRELWAEPHGDDKYELKLIPLDAGYFTQRFLHEFSPQVNEMARQLLSIQGNLLARKLKDAELGLATLQNQYPNLAATFVLEADLHLIEGDKNKAKASLQRAISIDPKDAAAVRLLRSLNAAGDE